MSPKKKRVSKKNKQAWRKHVDIKDVEEFLEGKRADERLGAPVNILPNTDLFKIETKPNNKKPALSISEKRKILYNTTPRCFKLLEPLTKVPDPITKRNRVRTKEERKDRIVKSIEESNKKRGIVKEKVKNAEFNRTMHKLRKIANTYKKGDITQDLWEADDKEPIKELQNEWFETITKIHNYQGLGKLQKNTPKTLHKKTSILPNIETPHPGMSYNPSFKDHQELLQEIAKVEMEIIKEEKHLDRVTKSKFKMTTASKRDENWLKEMSEGLNEEKSESDSDGEFKSVNPPVKNKKKDRKQRRKQKEQQILQQNRMKTKIEKKKISDLYRLRFLNKEIEDTKKKTEMLQAKREKLKQYKLLEPKRIGTQKFEAPDLEFNMVSDISGNLRNLKSDGNLLKDRFKSLQKRNILEPSTMQLRKKPGKVKKIEKASHKMGWESKGY